ncbi:hypothetical protein TcasGA2_TC006947 [Tribolium castaneum]|uniref:Uncharacterized protein n=1 Tax=Tribolium castaneum TaxID=7070 RepID=D7EJT7_TRICA|nr:hypothetical protein TcasGA2_TC006947 [Tribolium castaneum]
MTRLAKCTYILGEIILRAQVTLSKQTLDDKMTNPISAYHSTLLDSIIFRVFIMLREADSTVLMIFPCYTYETHRNPDLFSKHNFCYGILGNDKTNPISAYVTYARPYEFFAPTNTL